MGNQDWYNLGDEIKNIVQDAIDSRDYSRLNETVGRTINSTMDVVSDGLRSAGQAVDQAMDNIQDSMQQGNRRYRDRAMRERRQNIGREQGKSYRYGPRIVGDSSQKEREAGEPVRSQTQSRQVPAAPYARTTSDNAVGYALTITGGILSGGLGIATFVLMVLLIAFGNETGIVVSVAIMFPLLMASIWMTLKGNKIRGRVKRFRNYVRQLGNRTYCGIQDLANAIGKSNSYVVKDLQTMIAKGMFLEGHIDKKQTCLMVTNEAFQQYQAAEKQLEERQAEAKRLASMTKEERKAEGRLSPEVQAVMKEGNQYIEKLKRCNDAIPGMEISQKITRIEVLVRKIFERVEQDPKIVPELRKMMEYYLPTTIKLLEAYQDLDSQPIQGENIKSSKKEIEQTLDTINLAFEKLLDRFFKDTAWDVSTDISVLQTMLAQEGLTKEDF